MDFVLSVVQNPDSRIRGFNHEGHEVHEEARTDQKGRPKGSGRFTSQDGPPPMRSDQSIILVMKTDPDPREIFPILYGERPMGEADPCRPERTDLLET